MIGKSKKTIPDVLLDDAGVDRVSMMLQEWMAQKKVQQKNIVRFRLVVENLLENLCSHYDRTKHVSVEMGRRFGATDFLIRYPGDAYNPIQTKETDAWTAQLLANIGLMPVWRRKRGVNELVLRLPRNKLRSEIWLIVAFLSALILGLLKPVLPPAVIDVATNYVFSSLSTIFLNLLGTFAGAMVFLTVICGICGVGNVADFSKMGRYLVGRNMLFSFLGAGVCAVLMIPFFTLRMGSFGGAFQLSAITDLVLQIVPKDPVTPFMTGNMLQIIFLAVMIGAVIAMLGSKVKGMQSALMQANAIAQEVISIVCKLLALYILSSMTLLFWENGMDIFASIWKPLVLCVLSGFGIMTVKILIVALRCKVGPLKLLRKMLPGFLIGLSTASSIAAFGTVMEENEKKLGIGQQLNNFGFPIELIVNESVVSSGFIAIIYFLAEYNDVAVSVSWFVSAWLLITIMSYAMPPVSGGTLVCLGVLLAQFNISPACLGMASVIALLDDFVMTACRIVICQMELVLEAKHWNLLDVETLRG